MFFEPGGLPAELSSQADVLHQRCGDELETVLRRLGLYDPHIQILVAETGSGPQVVAHIGCQAGELAFTERDGIEATVAAERDANRNLFLDTRARYAAIAKQAP